MTVISVDSAVNSDNVAAYIGADNYGAGRMVAQSVLDGMEGALCVGLINYEVNGANGRDREQGARDAFAESGRARITAAVSTHPNAASARADTLAMLRTHPEINVLIALNETTAVGAAQAVQQMQRADDLWLAAFDSNIETIDALQTGTVDTLIVQNTYGMGYFGVESAYKLLAGQGSSVEKSNITATRTITRENMFAMDKQKALFPCGCPPKPGPCEPTAKALLPRRRRGFFIFPSPAKILQNENNKHPFVTFAAHSAQKQTLSTGETALNGENFHP